MKFSRLLFWSLLGPVIVISAPYIYSLSVMWRDPSSSSEARGIGVLLVMSALTALVEFIAVPVAVIRMWRYPDYVTVPNVIVVVIGAIPVAICLLLLVSLLFYHG